MPQAVSPRALFSLYSFARQDQFLSLYEDYKEGRERGDEEGRMKEFLRRINDVANVATMLARSDAE